MANKEKNRSLLTQVTGFQKDSFKLHINSDDHFIQMIARGLGENLRMFVDSDTGKVLYLEGTEEEIFQANRDFYERMGKVNEFLQNPTKNVKKIMRGPGLKLPWNK